MASREYAVLKTSIVESVPPGDYNVEILCEIEDAQLLLHQAKQFCPSATPYIEQGIASLTSKH